MVRKLWYILCAVIWVWLISPSMSQAHVGAPYPVLLEEPVGPYVASALADPDVGTGTFYILVTMPAEEPPSADTIVTVWVEPQAGHLPEAGYPAERQQTRYGERFVAKVPFDTEGPWQVRLAIDGQAGQGETSFPVKVTPSGIGWLATLGCLVPFLLLGALWLRGAQRQRSGDKT